MGHSGFQTLKSIITNMIDSVVMENKIGLREKMTEEEQLDWVVREYVPEK